MVFDFNLLDKRLIAVREEKAKLAEMQDAFLQRLINVCAEAQTLPLRPDRKAGPRTTRSGDYADQAVLFVREGEQTTIRGILAEGITSVTQEVIQHILRDDITKGRLKAPVYINVQASTKPGTAPLLSEEDVEVGVDTPAELEID